MLFSVLAAVENSGDALDKEALSRGNSVYFPRRVIPMLPEVLSNGLCSLQENQPRLTKSAFIEYDARGNRKSTRFANTVMKLSAIPDQRQYPHRAAVVHRSHHMLNLSLSTRGGADHPASFTPPRADDPAPGRRVGRAQ